MRPFEYIIIAVAVLAIIAAIVIVCAYLKRKSEYELAYAIIHERDKVEKGIKDYLDDLSTSGAEFNYYYALSESDFGKTENKMMHDIRFRIAGGIGRKLVQAFDVDEVRNDDGEVVGYELNIKATKL